MTEPGGTIQGFNGSKRILSRKGALAIAEAWREEPGGPVDRFVLAGGEVADEAEREVLGQAVSDLFSMARSGTGQLARLNNLNTYVNHIDTLAWIEESRVTEVPDADEEEAPRPVF